MMTMKNGLSAVRENLRMAVMTSPKKEHHMPSLSVSAMPYVT
jgi:hypothetical protein